MIKFFLTVSEVIRIKNWALSSKNGLISLLLELLITGILYPSIVEFFVSPKIYSKS